MTDNKLNRLERKAIQGAQTESSARWQQAEEIVCLLDQDETERSIAASWKRGETGKSYDQKTVHRFAATWRKYEAVPPQGRPAFWKAVEKAAGGSTRIERNEAQAPRSVETAEKLVENLVEKAPDEIVETVYYGLKEAMKAEPIERREKTDKTFTQKFGDAAFRIWRLHDEFQDAAPSRGEVEHLRVLAQTMQAFCESLVGALDAGQPLSIDDELQEMIEGARREQQTSA